VPPAELGGDVLVDAFADILGWLDEMTEPDRARGLTGADPLP
jgi:hypothetical protein